MKIFLDMDGVLANFVKAVAELFAVEYEHLLADWITNHPGEYSVVPRLLDQMKREDHEPAEWDDDVMWDQIYCYGGAEYWESLEPYPWAMDLWRTCNDYADKNVYIASAPACGAHSPAGKVKWLRRHFSIGPNRYILGSRKDLLARSDTILIDDADSNVEAFVGAGGHAILFPQPWNSNHDKADFPMVYVMDRLLLMAGG